MVGWVRNLCDCIRAIVLILSSKESNILNDIVIHADDEWSRVHLSFGSPGHRLSLLFVQTFEPRV